MKEFYVKTSCDDAMFIKADFLKEDNDHLFFYKDDEIIAEIKEWYYWLEKLST